MGDKRCSGYKCMTFGNKYINKQIKKWDCQLQLTVVRFSLEAAEHWFNKTSFSKLSFFSKAHKYLPNLFKSHRAHFCAESGSGENDAEKQGTNFWSH